MFRKEFYGELEEIEASRLKSINENARESRSRVRATVRRAKEHPVVLELIRMAISTDIIQWYTSYGLTMLFDDHQRPWLVPRLAELLCQAVSRDKPSWYLDTWSPWGGYDQLTRDGKETTHALKSIYEMHLTEDFVLSITIRKPVHVVLAPEQEYVLPNGCVVKRQIDASLSDSMVTQCGLM